MAQWLSQTRKMNNHYQSAGTGGGWNLQKYHFPHKLYLFFDEQDNTTDLKSNGIFLEGYSISIVVIDAPYKENGIIIWQDYFNLIADYELYDVKVKDMGMATVETTFGINQQHHNRILLDFFPPVGKDFAYEEDVEKVNWGPLDIKPISDIIEQGVQIVIDHYEGSILTDCCELEIKTKNTSEYSVINELFNNKFHSSDFISAK